jgi:peptide/nickel transport system substrate-binding protein
MVLLAGAATLAAQTREELMAAHRGETPTLVATSAGGTIDPQINYTLQY